MKQVPLKICVVTGSRAEYGLLYWVMKALQQDESFELQVIATGMHLSPEFGLTYKQIEKDGFSITRKIEMLLSSDTEVAICKSTGLGMISFSEAFEELKPDLVLVLGDRFEIFAAATAAMISKLCVAHCHGGETTEAIIDEPIRHSITKMSHLHFTATEEYRKRVIQLGEHPSRVFNVGGLGIENINRLNFLDREAFEESLGFKLNKRNILVTFHSVTLENNTAEEQFKALLEAVDELQDTHIIFTKTNADTGGRIINDLIDEYVTANSHKAMGSVSLGQLLYLSALSHVDLVVGNSSSGLIEVPSFKIPTINIGDRQKGRTRAASVIDCKPEVSEIKKAIQKAYSKEFRAGICSSKNPYGTGNASEQILKVLKNTQFSDIIKKEFYNLP